MNQLHAVIGAIFGVIFIYFVFWLWFHAKPKKKLTKGQLTKKD